MKKLIRKQGNLIEEFSQFDTVMIEDVFAHRVASGFLYKAIVQPNTLNLERAILLNQVNNEPIMEVFQRTVRPEVTLTVETTRMVLIEKIIINTRYKELLNDIPPQRFFE